MSDAVFSKSTTEDSKRLPESTTTVIVVSVVVCLLVVFSVVNDCHFSLFPLSLIIIHIFNEFTCYSIFYIGVLCGLLSKEK